MRSSPAAPPCLSPECACSFESPAVAESQLSSVSYLALCASVLLFSQHRQLQSLLLGMSAECHLAFPSSPALIPWWARTVLTPGPLPLLFPRPSHGLPFLSDTLLFLASRLFQYDITASFLNLLSSEITLMRNLPPY